MATNIKAISTGSTLVNLMDLAVTDFTVTSSVSFTKSSTTGYFSWNTINGADAYFTTNSTYNLTEDYSCVICKYGGYMYTDNAYNFIYISVLQSGTQVAGGKSYFPDLNGGGTVSDTIFACGFMGLSGNYNIRVGIYMENNWYVDPLYIKNLYIK